MLTWRTDNLHRDPGWVLFAHNHGFAGAGGSTAHGPSVCLPYGSGAADHAAQQVVPGRARVLAAARAGHLNEENTLCCAAAHIGGGDFTCVLCSSRPLNATALLPARKS